ncbi:hypothetical protein [Natronosalvus amylolyticus]|uniref:hypothetical protein n=1 Tax=Natronosalvus amylolyticus TaxID=2961994 RepID=UPI0020C9EAA1|nr:hypothetical protein [Natronosalvus amylolyticus]
MSGSRLTRLVRHVRLISTVHHRIELRRRRNHPQLAAAVLLGALAGTMLIVGALPVPVYEHLWPEPGAYYYGTLVGLESERVLALSRELAAIAVVTIAGLGGLGAITSDNWERPPAEIVTAVPLPAAILGMLADELLESSWFVAPVVVGGVLAFTAGTNTPSTLVGAAVGGLAILLTGLVVGTAIGLTLRASIRRSPRLYRARYAVSVGFLFVVFMGLALSRRAGSTLASSPIGWYGDLLLVTTPGGGALPTRAAVALLASFVLLPLAMATVVTAGRSLWFAETTLDDGTVTPTRRGRIDRLLEAGFGRSTAIATRTVWRRMRRSPRAMVYVVLPLAVAGPVTVELSAAMPALLPVLFVLYLASAVGLGTTLNPLGNERVALPLVRTTPGGVDTVLRGHVLAALVPGVPFVVAVGTVLGLVVGYPPWGLVAFVMGASLVTVGGIGWSLAIGAALPNLEGPTEASLAPPELYAMVAFLSTLLIVAFPLLVGFGLGFALAPAGAVLTVGGTVATAGASVVGGYRFARRRLETFE